MIKQIDSFYLWCFPSFHNNFLLELHIRVMVRVRAMVINYISITSWGSVLLVAETSIPGEYHRPVASRWQTLSHTIVSSTSALGTHNMCCDITDCTGSCKSNYHTFTATMALLHIIQFCRYQRRNQKSSNFAINLIVLCNCIYMYASIVHSEHKEMFENTKEVQKY